MPGAVLWTDDHVQALLARREHGVRRVWTQFVLGERASTGNLSWESFFESSARLVGYGYFFTFVTPQILREAAVIAEWKVTSWPFAQALAELEKDYLDLRTVMQVAAEFLKTVYIETLMPETQTAITIQILEHLWKRKNGMSAIRAIREALPRIFGLNVIGMAAALKTIDAWLKSK